MYRICLGFKDDVVRAPMGPGIGHLSLVALWRIDAKGAPRRIELIVSVWKLESICDIATGGQFVAIDNDLSQPLWSRLKSEVNAVSLPRIANTLQVCNAIGYGAGDEMFEHLDRRISRGGTARKTAAAT